MAVRVPGDERSTAWSASVAGSDHAVTFALGCAFDGGGCMGTMMG